MNHLLSQNIRYYRRAQGMTQLQLAEKLFVAAQTVSKWESGISEPDTERLCAMADLFAVSLDTLVRCSKDPSRRAYVAVDGGGTKTAFLLFDEGGELLDSFTLGGSNPNAYGLERSKSVLAEGIDRLLTSAVTVEGLYAGIAGASVGENREKLQNFLKERYPFFKSRVEGDIYNVIYSAGEVERCVAVICGTGSVVYGYDGERLRRAGGWGYLFDEAGSGFDMGRDLFRYCLACEDGTAEKTALYDAVCREVGGSPVFDRLSSIYTKGKDYIASFSRTVMAFYEQNDPVCAAIVEKTCDRIADLVAQVRVGADCGSTVVVAGGLTARADLLLPLLRKRLGDVDVVIPKMPPLFGAALRCARIFGAEIDESAFERSFAEII